MKNTKTHLKFIFSLIFVLHILLGCKTENRQNDYWFSIYNMNNKVGYCNIYSTNITKNNKLYHLYIRKFYYYNTYIDKYVKVTSYTTLDINYNFLKFVYFDNFIPNDKFIEIRNSSNIFKADLLISGAGLGIEYNNIHKLPTLPSILHLYKINNINSGNFLFFDTKAKNTNYLILESKYKIVDFSIIDASSDIELNFCKNQIKYKVSILVDDDKSEYYLYFDSNYNQIYQQHSKIKNKLLYRIENDFHSKVLRFFFKYIYDLIDKNSDSS